MWGYSSGAQSNAIVNLVSKPETTLLDVLEDSSLSPAIRNPSITVVNFFVQRINELFDWVIKDVHADHPRYVEIQRKALSVLASNSGLLQKQFYKNEDFLNNLKSFMQQTEFVPRHCGNFAKVVEFLSRSTNFGGEFLKSLPELPQFLATHLPLLGLLELFVNLTMDCGNYFDVSPKLATLVARSCAGPQGGISLIALSSIIKQKPHDGFRIFDSPDVITALLEAALDPTTPPLAIVGIFAVINRILFATEKNLLKSQPDLAKNLPQALELIPIREVLNSFCPRFDLDHRNADFTTPNMLIAFNYVNTALLDKYIANPNEGCLGHAIYYVLTHSAPEKLQEIFEQSNFIEKIEKSISENLFPKISGHFLSIVEFLTSLPDIYKESDKIKAISEKYPNLKNLIFSNEKCSERWEMRNKEFGGEHRAPQEESSDDGEPGRTEAFVEPSHNLFSDSSDSSDSESSSEEDDNDNNAGAGWLNDTNSDESSDDSLDLDNQKNDDFGNENFPSSPPAFGLPPLGDDPDFGNKVIPPPPPFIPEELGDGIPPPPPFIPDDGENNDIIINPALVQNENNENGNGKVLPPPPPLLASDDGEMEPCHAPMAPPPFIPSPPASDDELN